MGDEIQQLDQTAFPPLLSEIPDSPAHLYYKGVLPSTTCAFLCVVGSRKYSPYGKEACEKLIAGLRGYPIVIVSGLALGIDAIAHRAALSVGLITLAVPGSGLMDEVLYPATNRNLAKEILRKGGALISEFEPDFRARPESFPQRNRIMAGLSHAVLVIEASARSGTLITARLASEYNRDVLTVPGSIFSLGSAGPHMLMRLGATPVHSSEDILDALNLNIGTSDVPILEGLSDNERKVVELLSTPSPRDELIARAGLSAREANILLSTMELKGIIVERMGEIHLV